MTPDEARQHATLTVPEAARLLGVGRNQAYEAARTGQLPVVRLGGRLLVPTARLFAELLGDTAARTPEPVGSGPATSTNHGGTSPDDRHA